MSGQARAMEPEEVTRLVAERLNAGDAAGVAALYEPEAVLAYPADRPTTGREAIRAVYQQLVDAGVTFSIETPLPTVRFEDLALTSTRSADNTGVRVQVLRRQPDGSWLRIRSEERRVGKECRCRWSLYHYKKKQMCYEVIASSDVIGWKVRHDGIKGSAE